MGIADDQLAIGRRTDQQMNSVLVQVRRFAQDLRLNRRRFR